jgi:branched-chain amino acid transport system permease protein
MSHDSQSAVKAPDPRATGMNFGMTRIAPAVMLVAAIALALMGGSFYVQLATQVMLWWCFGLSYQLLFGRTGMLSFGHAVNFGLAAFVTAHAVRWLGSSWPVYELLPLVGAFVGLCCGVVLGFPVTRRSGVAFSMVTLGLGELVAACFLMFPAFFGGEAGVTLHRTDVRSLFGFDYGKGGAQLLFTAAWSCSVLATVHWLAGTPFGMATLAVRDNAQRAEFSGFCAANIRWVSYLVASTLAGVAGALSALAFEIVTVDSVSLHTSADVLLMTVIGGIGSTFGPLLGAIFLTVMNSVVSGWTRAWLFYYGFVFVTLVWLAPQGIAGLCLSAWQRRSMPRAIAASAATVLGFAVVLVVFIETAYQIFLGEASRLPGWHALGSTALLTIFFGSGLTVAVWLMRVVSRSGSKR